MNRTLQRLVQLTLAAVVATAAATVHAETTTCVDDRPAGIVSYRGAVARAASSVVTVHALQASKAPIALAPKTAARGLASGVIVDRNGYIVTNYHVIEDASQLAVAHPNGTIYGAEVVGTDRASDLAVLKIDGDDLQPIVFADIDEVEVGDVVLAVGNPFGIGQTVTQGIVSAIVRRGTEPVDNFVQTDAAINPGNSGGALVDTAGRLVGINTVILSKSGGSEGIGFAIPADSCKRWLPRCERRGTSPVPGSACRPRRHPAATVRSSRPSSVADRRNAQGLPPATSSCASATSRCVTHRTSTASPSATSRACACPWTS